MSFIRLDNGSVLQHNCSTNPSSPMKRFVPSICFEQDVISLTCVRTNFETLVTIVLAGLRSGQVCLVHPNIFNMKNIQAHSG